jgi:cytochrome c-type biogenesis protein CcmE
MKISHIFIIVIIAVTIGVIVSTAGNASEYVGFDEAFELAANGKTKKIHVVGTLKKNTEGEIVGMLYNPVLDPNYFVFTLADNKGLEKQVVYYSPKPQDFEKSEQVVVIGAVRNNTFIADEILLKCPSKYQENEIKI